ncbi:hypothetical protein L6452_22381 [Arctium lappa]|uniref:Uncharacterized protein n=1 Tax=Arctium lappa TaxID=4217 RepID=A0ACB9AZ85_ARCLA|nr:hypothetical protein L6452_22381 [Arctium lappa]
MRTTTEKPKNEPEVCVATVDDQYREDGTNMFIGDDEDGEVRRTMGSSLGGVEGHYWPFNSSPTRNPRLSSSPSKAQIQKPIPNHHPHRPNPINNQRSHRAAATTVVVSEQVREGNGSRFMKAFKAMEDLEKRAIANTDGENGEVEKRLEAISAFSQNL